MTGIEVFVPIDYWLSLKQTPWSHGLQPCKVRVLTLITLSQYLTVGPKRQRRAAEGADHPCVRVPGSSKCESCIKNKALCEKVRVRSGSNSRTNRPGPESRLGSRQSIHRGIRGRSGHAGRRCKAHRAGSDGSQGQAFATMLRISKKTALPPMEQRLDEIAELLRVLVQLVGQRVRKYRFQCVSNANQLSSAFLPRRLRASSPRATRWRSRRTRRKR